LPFTFLFAPQVLAVRYHLEKLVRLLAAER